jgi:hypothetical protein
MAQLTRDEKEQFIKDLMGNVQSMILNKLDRVPEEWDGYELREWIADAFDWERLDRTKNINKRLKEYKNEVIVKDLI